MQHARKQKELVSALVDGSIAELAQRSFDITRIGCSSAAAAHVQRGSWRRVAQSIDDVQTAERAYFAVCQRVNVDHAICRVFLDDLAEWLVLSPMVYRRIRTSTTQVENKRQKAA